MDAPAWARKDFVREPRLARESLANFEHGNGSLRRLSALVLFGHASASKRLSLIFHGQYPIADRQSVHRKRHQTARALIGHHLEMVGLERKSVVYGKSVSVRVDLGGRRII